MIDRAQCDAVERVPGKVGGTCVVRATRVPVSAPFENLEDGAARKLVDLPEAIRRLRATSIFLADEVVDGVLKRHERRQQDPGPSR